MRLVAVVTLAILSISCSSKDTNKPAPVDSAKSNAPAILGSAPGAPDCPATGLWAKCSVLYRLARAGLVPHPDSTAKPDEHALHGNSFVVLFGANSRLEVFLYADSASRIKDEGSLDRKEFVNATATQTIKRERTLIENANLVAVLTSLNERLRERVSDALTAGAPQPSGK